MTGTVKRIVPLRKQPRRTPRGGDDYGGYFFIRDDNGNDRFAHANDLRNAELDALKIGDRVRFDPDDAGAGGNGLRAEHVDLVSA